jgi:hypothetical protein
VSGVAVGMIKGDADAPAQSFAEYMASRADAKGGVALADAPAGRAWGGAPDSSSKPDGMIALKSAYAEFEDFVPL